MAHRLLFVDAETYYDDQYSLRKMAPPNYILDPRFELICCAVKEGAEPSYLVDGPDFGRFLSSLDPANTTIVAYNALFDLCILAWRYRFAPRHLLCSMRMAVALRGHTLPGASLAAVAESLGVGTKGTEIQNVKGMHRAEIRASGRWNAYARYCLNDNELQAAIFFKLINEYPVAERRLMDRVLRCAVEPEFWVDTAMLKAHLQELRDDKVKLLQAAGVTDPSSLRSKPQFEAILRSYGVEVDYKPTAAGETPAFAKTDEFMSRLLEHEDPAVAALAAARLGVSSTIEERRGERMLSIANLDWSCYRDGNAPLMPMPYRISGAHTHRLSGEWLLNMQNLPSGRGGKSKLRQSLIAPPGHRVLIGDLSQIEARINAWVCGQADMVQAFAEGKDLYSLLASAIFGIPLDQIDKKGLERFIGKAGELGLGFRCGAAKFYNMVIRSARVLGMDMAELMRVWTDDLAQRTVDVYRANKPGIKNAWYALDSLLAGPWCGVGPPQKWGSGGIVEIGDGYVLLPNSMKMNYAVECRDPNQDLTYRYGKTLHKMHGGVLLENIVQALARIVIMHAADRLWQRGLKFKLQSHDELGFIVPDAAVGRDARGKPTGPFVELLRRELSRRPSWAPELPLACEIEFGRSYGDAK